MLFMFNKCHSCTFFYLTYKATLSLKCVLIIIGFIFSDKYDIVSDAWIDISCITSKSENADLQGSSVSLIHADPLLKGFLFSSFPPTAIHFLILSVAFKLHFLTAVE